MNQKVLAIILLFAFILTANAEIKFNGDARVRPRIDQKFDKDGKTYEDMYYLYWVRIWAKATLTDGWFAQAKLATDGPADWIGKMGADGTYDKSPNWDKNNSNGVIRWSEAFFGKNGKKAGFSMGLLPLNGITNHELDLHYFPGTQSDIPYFIYNRNSATGFRGYYKINDDKLCATVTVDNNVVQFDNVDSTKDVNDQYSILLNYNTKIAGFSLQPTFIKTIAPKGKMSPLTAGLNLKFPEFSGFNFSGAAYYTMQDDKDAVLESDKTIAGKYDGFMLNAKITKKIGPGSFISWVDYSSIDMDISKKNKNTFYLWIMYKYVVYKSDAGAFAVMPTFRRIQQKFDKAEYARNKIEVTMQLSF